MKHLKCIVVMAFLVGCQKLHGTHQRDFSGIVQCQSGCQSLYQQGHILTHAQKKRIHHFIKHHHRRPILISPCHQQHSDAWTHQVQAFITHLGASVMVVKPSYPLHAKAGRCVNLLAGPLTIRPYPCQPIDGYGVQKAHQIGCHTQAYLDRQIEDPLDLYIQPGTEGKQP